MTESVNAYLARLPHEQRLALEDLRDTIRTLVPEAEEVIRVGVPAFRYQGRPLVSIGAAKRHVALYVMYSSVLKQFADELEAFDATHTVVRFTPDSPLPPDLVRRLVDARRSEIETVGANRASRLRAGRKRADRTPT